MSRIYTFTELEKSTALDSRLVARIKSLVDSYKVTIKAAKEGSTFIACTGSTVFSYDAVLYLSTERAHYTIDEKHRPADMLAKVAELLTREAKIYGKF
jgi:hypothetical protein